MNRISIFLTMFIPLLFAGSLVMAPNAAATPPETFGPFTPVPADIHASLPPRPAPSSWEAVLAAGTGSVGASAQPVPGLGTLPGLLRPDPLRSGALLGVGTGSAGDLPRIVGDLLRLLDLVRQVPLPLPPH
ncbi:hypothetical protein ACLMAL_18675 [Nocardia sp. CWNU-33]|uniref:hypothetical protein n=1 Tax=Nocardia sp. CWNU-33 TaxID=3392117 RepID=UPI00398F1712